MLGSGASTTPVRIAQSLPKTSLNGKERTFSVSTVLAFKRSKRGSPAIENGQVAPPRRVTNLTRCRREHLAPAEVERLIVAAGKVGRHGSRDGTLILLAYRHGLRASEIGLLQRADVDVKQGRISIHRLKGSISGIYPMQPDILKAVRSYVRTREDEILTN